jgi:hypothetical protein
VHAVWPQEAQPFPAKLTSLTPPNSHSSRSTGPGSKHEAIERDLLNPHDNHMRTFPRPGRSPLLGSNHACRQYGPGPCFFFFLVSWSSPVQGPGPCFLFSKQTHVFVGDWRCHMEKHQRRLPESDRLQPTGFLSSPL